MTDVWATIFANLVHNGLKKIEEVPANLRDKVTALLESTSEPV